MLNDLQFRLRKQQNQEKSLTKNVLTQHLKIILNLKLYVPFNRYVAQFKLFTQGEPGRQSDKWTDGHPDEYSISL